jgi:glycogen(starch) synthase
MRVLFWTLTFWPNIGGLEVFAARLLPNLRRRGHEFIVVAPKHYTGEPEQELYQGIPIHRLEFRSNLPCRIDRLTEIRQKVIRIKRAFAPDLIHMNGVGATDFFHLTTREAHRAPVVVTLHNPWRAREESIVRLTLRAADWVAGVSAAILDEALKLEPEIGNRCSVIYNSVAPRAPSRNPLSSRRPHLLCLGRLVPDKGFDVAINAFRLVLNRFPSARLTIAGDGPLRSELEQQAVRAGVGRAVEFIGWVAPERAPSLIANCTIVLMPSRREPFGLVALEAASAGRPVVATRIGGLPEIVIHHETGLLVEDEDCRSLADAAVSLLSNPGMALQFGEAARRRARDVFAWENHVGSYDALYRQFAGSAAAVRTTLK